MRTITTTALLAVVAWAPLFAKAKTINFTTTEASVKKWTVVQRTHAGTMQKKHPVWGNYGYGDAFTPAFKFDHG